MGACPSRCFSALLQWSKVEALLFFFNQVFNIVYETEWSFGTISEELVLEGAKRKVS